MPTPRRGFPSAPDLPVAFDAAPPTFGSRNAWTEIDADDTVVIADWVADAELTELRWSRAQAVGRRFTGLQCRDVRFVGGDFAGASLVDARLTRVSFESCRLTGMVFAGSALQDVHLVDCTARQVDFRMARLRRFAADRCDLRDADFYAADLHDVRLADCELGSANFEAARCKGVQLRGSSLDGVRAATFLAGATIDAEQILPLGAALVAALNFRVN